MTRDFTEAIRSRMGECDNLCRMSGAIEFILPVEETVACDLVRPSDNLRDVVNTNSGDVFLGVHETSPKRAREIVAGGFDPGKTGEQTVNDIPLRENAVYAWHFEQNITISEGRWGVVVSAPRSSVTVSLMSAAVMRTPEEYLSDYTMEYPTFISCLRGSDKKPKVYGLPVGESDIVQDITDYKP